MPELPEVETIRRELQQVMLNHRIIDVDIRLAKMVHVPANQFRRAVLKSKIIKIERRAKILLITLSSGWTVIIHLKMTGQLIWQGTKGRMRVGGHPIPGGIDDLPNKFSHVIVRTSGGTLYFNDQRQFGYMKMIKTADRGQWLANQGYGPEPLSRSFTLTRFQQLMVRHAAKKIKPTLMDQTVIAGIGNIYADEALFSAKVRPDRRIKSLTPKEQKDLWRSIRHVLTVSIKHKGTSADTYRTTTGAEGQNMKFIRVYGRSGERCRRCGGTIVRTVLAARGTHSCPGCQR